MIINAIELTVMNLDPRARYSILLLYSRLRGIPIENVQHFFGVHAEEPKE